MKTAANSTIKWAMNQFVQFWLMPNFAGGIEVLSNQPPRNSVLLNRHRPFKSNVLEFLNSAVTADRSLSESSIIELITANLQTLYQLSRTTPAFNNLVQAAINTAFQNQNKLYIQHTFSRPGQIATLAVLNQIFGLSHLTDTDTDTDTERQLAPSFPTYTTYFRAIKGNDGDRCNIKQVLDAIATIMNVPVVPTFNWQEFMCLVGRMQLTSTFDNLHPMSSLQDYDIAELDELACQLFHKFASASSNALTKYHGIAFFVVFFAILQKINLADHEDRNPTSRWYSLELSGIMHAADTENYLRDGLQPLGFTAQNHPAFPDFKALLHCILSLYDQNHYQISPLNRSCYRSLVTQLALYGFIPPIVIMASWLVTSAITSQESFDPLITLQSPLMVAFFCIAVLCTLCTTVSCIAARHEIHSICSSPSFDKRNGPIMLRWMRSRTSFRKKSSASEEECTQHSSLIQSADSTHNASSSYYVEMGSTQKEDHIDLTAEDPAATGGSAYCGEGAPYNSF